MPQKEILNLKSKVQYKHGIPFIYFIKHLSKRHLRKGEEIECKLVMNNNKLNIVIEVG